VIPMGEVVFQMIVSGVGGQGSIRISHVIADAAIRQGFSVKVGEKFGAAMRGGAVSSHVRMGRGEFSPMIPEGEAHAIMSLEPLEGFRAAVRFLRPGGVFVTNSRPVYPVDVNTGRARYPDVEAFLEGLRQRGFRVYWFDATKLAIEAGSAKAMNSVVLGALYSLGVLPIDRENLLEALREGVPRGTEELNLRAFEAGERALSP